MSIYCEEIVQPARFALVVSGCKDYRVFDSGYVEYLHEYENTWFECGPWDNDYDAVKAVGLQKLQETAV